MPDSKTENVELSESEIELENEIHDFGNNPIPTRLIFPSISSVQDHNETFSHGMISIEVDPLLAFGVDNHE